MDARRAIRLGCVRSLIPEREPSARLAALQLDDYPQYRLLEKTVRTTLFSCGRFPAYLRDGDCIESLVEEGISLGTGLLGRSDAEVRSGAKSIARRLIHREKVESRWFEIDATGRRVRRSEAEMRIAHPVQHHNEEGDLEWSDPTDEVTVDVDGHIVAHGNINFVEARMVARLDQLRLRMRVISVVGADNYLWMVAYIERKRGGVPIPPPDRDKFRSLKNKVLSASTKRPD